MGRFSRRALFFAFLLMALIVFVALGLTIGSAKIPIDAAVKIVLSGIPGLSKLGSGYPKEWSLIILRIRLPIVLMALFAGMGLASSGSAMQGLFKNPLVDPFIIGISAGGALGTVLGTVLSRDMDPTAGRMLKVALSFIIGLGTVYLAYFISRSGNRMSVSNLLLAGIALSALMTSATYLAIYFLIQNPSEMIFSLMGSCGNTRWEELYIVVPVVLLGGGALIFFGRDLNAFSLGEEGAKHVGVDVEKSKFLILSLAALITAVTVPFCGIIGFVGLIIPHIVRRFIGADHRYLLPGSALLGGSFLIACDLFSRAVLDVVIPLGIVTGFMGGFFFIYLLWTGRWTR